MVTLFKRLVSDQTGQDLAEYAVALALIGLALLAAVLVLEEILQLLWNGAVRAITE